MYIKDIKIEENKKKKYLILVMCQIGPKKHLAIWVFYLRKKIGCFCRSYTVLVRKWLTEGFLLWYELRETESSEKMCPKELKSSGQQTVNLLLYLYIMSWLSVALSSSISSHVSFGKL